MKRAWAFNAAFDVFPIDIDAASRETAPQTVHDPSEQEFISALVVKKQNEIKNRKKDS